MHWLLPEYFADVLPARAARIERLRRVMLERLRTCGYELVMPPILEYVESLLTGAGADLDLQTFKLIDQISGRTLGVRADMTPQAARIDAHLLNREGVVRLCYCGSVLRTLPTSISASREPLQIGAELYGHAGLAADREVLRLLASVLSMSGVADYRLDMGHAGIFRALVRFAKPDTATEAWLLEHLQAKDISALQDTLAHLPQECREAIVALPDLYGEPKDVLSKARAKLPAQPEVVEALQTLQDLVEAIPELDISLDLADLRGYHYHNGIVFAAYAAGYPAPLALGGRYDGVGAEFGRSRPATGFSLDLKELERCTPHDTRTATAILAPYVPDDQQLRKEIEQLRSSGAVVIECLSEEAPLAVIEYDKQLVKTNGQWSLSPLPASEIG